MTCRLEVPHLCLVKILKDTCNFTMQAPTWIIQNKICKNTYTDRFTKNKTQKLTKKPHQSWRDCTVKCESQIVLSVPPAHISRTSLPLLVVSGPTSTCASFLSHTWKRLPVGHMVTYHTPFWYSDSPPVPATVQVFIASGILKPKAELEFLGQYSYFP